MTNRENIFKEIENYLTFIQLKLKNRNSLNLQDINIMAEDFFKDLFNIIFGYNLKNINQSTQNAPSIDLYDDENKIAIQVTSDNSREKINKTIELFINNKLYQKYKLMFIIINDRLNYQKNFDTKGLFDFNQKEDIIFIINLLNIIKSKELNKQKEILEFLQNEISIPTLNKTNQFFTPPPPKPMPLS